MQLVCLSLTQNCYFGKSRHLSDPQLQASQFCQSLQKLSLVFLESFGIGHEHHKQHLLLSHCCHTHVLFYLKHKSFYVIVNVAMYISSSAIDLRSKRKCLLKICREQEAKIESLNICKLCVGSMPIRQCTLPEKINVIYR